MDIDIHRQTLRGSMDSNGFFGADQAPSLDDDKDGYGRYLLDADGKGKAPYTRATTIAKMLDSTRGLEIWQQRKVAKGVAQSPALVARAAVTPLDDKQAWREIIEQAEVKSGGDEKRDLGSAFHALHEHVETMTDDEWAAVPDDLRATYVKYRAELQRLGIEEVMTEGTCVNTRIGTAGKFDAIFRLADGRLVIGDRKSGRITEYPHSAAVQLATYANSDVLITWDGNGAVIRHAMPELDLTTAIVIDVKIGDENTASVHVYEVDIWAGWAAALLSAKVRQWRNRRDLLVPYHPDVKQVDWSPAPAAARSEPVNPLADYPTIAPPAPVPNASDTPISMPPQPLSENQAWFENQTPGQPQPVEPADRPDANDANNRLGGPNVQPPHAAHPITHQAWSSAEQRNITLNPDGSRADGLTGPQVSAVLQPDPSTQVTTTDGTVVEGDQAALLATFKTKAQLQAVLATINPGANLARQRKNLAADIVSHPTWAQRRTEFLPVTQEEVPHTGGPTGVDDTSFSPVVSNAPGPVPPDPEPNYPTLADAAGAQADAGVNPFLTPAPTAAPEEPLEDQLLRAIGEAASMDDLAAIWQRANDGGIGWPPRLHTASSIRQKQLTSAAPAAQ